MYKSFLKEELDEKPRGFKNWNKLKFLVKMKKEKLGFISKLKTYMISNKLLKSVCRCFLKGDQIKKQTKHMLKV